MTVLPIPHSKAELTPEWIESAMAARYPGTRIEGVGIEDLPGYKPNKVRAFLRYAANPGNAPASIVIKGGFARGQISDYEQDLTRPLDLGMQMEARAYLEFVPTIEVETPAVFHAAVTGEGEGIIVMEDLGLRGGEFFTPFKTMDYGQALAFIDAHARIAARWWNDPELEDGAAFGRQTIFGQCGTRIHDEYLGEFRKPALWDTIILNPHNAGLPRRFRDRDRMGAAFDALAEANRGVPRTIVHGDEHIKNFYWTPEGRAGFADWCSRTEPWANSFAYFVTACIDSTDRKLWDRILVQRYLDGLRRHGVDAPSFEEAWLAYRRAIVFPLYCWIINNSALQPANVNCAYTARTAIAAIELESFEALDI